MGRALVGSLSPLWDTWALMGPGPRDWPTLYEPRPRSRLGAYIIRDIHIYIYIYNRPILGERGSRPLPSCTSCISTSWGGHAALPNALLFEVVFSAPQCIRWACMKRQHVAANATMYNQKLCWWYCFVRGDLCVLHILVLCI